MTKLERLKFIVSVVDRASTPLRRLQARLHQLGLEQLGILRSGFHTVGNDAADASRKIALITTALGMATAAMAALLAAAAPLAMILGTGLLASISTAHIAGVSQQAEQLSLKTGMENETIRTWQLVSVTEGIEGEFGGLGGIADIFDEINGNMGELDDKSSDLTKALNSIGLSAKQMKALKPDAFLNKVADQLDKLGKSDQEKIAFLSELAGDAEKLLPLLGKNNKEFQRLAHHAQAVGAIITPEQTKLMKVANKEWSMMKIGMEGIGNTFASVGGHFMQLFGPHMNQWFVDNATAMQVWANDSIAELKRLHGVFKRGGMQAVWEDLFPNLSVFLRRTGHFFSGFNQGFLKPFLATSKATYERVAAELGNTVGGAKALGRSFGAAILPIFETMMEATGDAVIFIERNWATIKQVFAWSPLGLVITNWGAITNVLQPVGNALRDLAEYFGLVAPGINSSGSALGTLFGVMAAGLGILLLNKLAFGAIYHVVLLYKSALALLKVASIAVTAATYAATVATYAATAATWLWGKATHLATLRTWLWNKAVIATRAIQVAWSTTLLLLDVLITKINLKTRLATLGTKLWAASIWLANTAKTAWAATLTWLSVLIGKINLKARLAAAGTALWTAATTAWGIAVAIATSPITLLIVAIGALAAGAYYLYQHWDKVTAYLANTSWGQVLLSVINAILHPLDTFSYLSHRLGSWWTTTRESLEQTTWGNVLLGAIQALFAPFEFFSTLMKSLTGGWDAVKSSLTDTTWGQAITATIDNVMAAINRFKQGWADLKGAAGEKLTQASDFAADSWQSTKSMAAKGWQATTSTLNSWLPDFGGGRAVGGLVRAGAMYQVNERMPELLLSGGNTYLMNSTAGRVVPLQSVDLAANDSNISRPKLNVPAGGLKSVIQQRVHNQQRRQTNNQRTIHIEQLTIQAQEVDAEKLLNELEMLA